MPMVSTVKEELRKAKKSYQLVSDCIAGEQAVKARGARYLPIPNASDDSRENKDRYDAYLTRAVFYNVTGRTIRGMVGQIFNRAPELTYPKILQPTIDDVTGVGVQIQQQFRQTTSNTVALGRAGLLSDFPDTGPDGASAEDISSGRVKGSITFYEPTRIINWRKVRNGSEVKLVLVVLEEDRITYQDIFTEKKSKQFRVLRLDESGYYVQEIYYDDFNAAKTTSTPTFANGERFDYIPFEFIGSEDNDPDIDEVPAYDLASINMGHYRNSADFEESVFVHGQPTLFISGLDDKFIDKYLRAKILLGSQFGVPLPVNSKAELLQAEPNSLVSGAMDRKERQMVALGARLIEQKQVQRTATEANQEQAAESSQLSTIAQNVSAAYSNALYSCNRFVSNNDADCTLKLNDSFDLNLLDANQMNAVIAAWQNEALAFGEMRATFRRAGIATLDDDAALSKITSEVKLRMANQPVSATLPAPGDPAGTGA